MLIVSNINNINIVGGDTESVVCSDGRPCDSTTGRDILSEPRASSGGDRSLRSQHSVFGRGFGEAGASGEERVLELSSPAGDPARPVGLRGGRGGAEGPRHELVPPVGAGLHSPRAGLGQEGQEEEKGHVVASGGPAGCQGRDRNGPGPLSHSRVRPRPVELLLPRGRPGRTQALQPTRRVSAHALVPGPLLPSQDVALRSL